FALAAAALEIGDGAAAEALEHALHRLRDQLGRIALGERRLTEARDLLLVARLRGAALLRAHALGEVARIHHQHAALRRVEQPPAALHREGAAVLALVLCHERVHPLGDAKAL